jgi:hypothetical protein
MCFMNVKCSCTLIEVILWHFQMSTPNQIFAPAPPTCILINFIVTMPVFILLIVLWDRSWAQLKLVDPFKEAAPRRLKLDCLC